MASLVPPPRGGHFGRHEYAPPPACRAGAGGDPPMFRTPLRRLIPRTTSSPPTHDPRTGRGGAVRALGYAAAHLAIVVLMLSVPAAAFADPSGPGQLAADDL